jgi:hypothetical protein
MTEKAHPLQRAWAAGIFDASANVPKAGYQIKILMADEVLIRRFHKTTGVGKVYFSNNKKLGVMGGYEWNSNSMDDAREAILFVAPLLSPRKTAKCAQLLRRIEENPTWRKQNPQKARTLDTARAKDADTPLPPLGTTLDG